MIPNRQIVLSHQHQHSTISHIHSCLPDKSHPVQDADVPRYIHKTPSNFEPTALSRQGLPLRLQLSTGQVCA